VNITFELLDQKMVWLLSYIEESPLKKLRWLITLLVLEFLQNNNWTDQGDIISLCKFAYAAFPKTKYIKYK
jgi:hypothetical protein